MLFRSSSRIPHPKSSAASRRDTPHTPCRTLSRTASSSDLFRGSFGDHRTRKSREFFRLSPDKPKAIIELLCIKNATPGQEIVADADDQEALNEERTRRSNFRFSLVDIKPGEQLQSVFDDNITCTVKNDRWVEFRGEEHSLSSAALAVAHEQGLGWTTIAGPQYWKHGGKTLSELREEATQGA